INIALSLGEGQPQPLRIYPNPTTGKTTIELGAYRGKEARLSLFDIAGKQIFTQAEVIQEKMELDISALPTGVYIVLVKIDHQYFRSRLLKD
ncbi:MAG: T9SS type A sorting domain-containing protein, partial [Bacteroidetes bacterium]|nr:T9SS type A sorting domain-containing protein [Bacteroidota bacterium]